MPKKVFIAYDFEIKGDLTLNLEAVAKKPGDDFEVRWPGAPDDRSQGAIWNSIVEPGIRWCDRLLAFTDLPNANVGFELGYGLALGKEVALARVKKELPAWLQQPPMKGFICDHIGTAGAIRKVIASGQWVQPPRASAKGDGVLVLCPADSAPLEEIQPEWDWRSLDKHGWNLHDVPELFEGISRVVWIIVAHNDGATGRDGADNAALSILAGYALGRGLTLDVFYHTSARQIVDVAARHEPFANLAALRTLLELVVEEHRQAIAAKAAPSPTAAQAALLTAEQERPRDLRPLPEDEWDTAQFPRFIGRERELADAAAAVKAIAANDPSAARVLWVHGFGGMGKSWFLRRVARAAVEAQPDLGVLLIEWDSAIWREPLTSEPATSADIYHAIAWRLAQVRGVAAADPYWLAQARVQRAAETHRTLEREFDARLTLAAQGERIESVLFDLLKDHQLVDGDGQVRRAALEKWRGDTARRASIFEAWARQAGACPIGGDADAAIVPQRVLERGLAEALLTAAATGPLLLLLDTCEVFSETLDRALRSLIAGLSRDKARILLLIGSRLAPDVAQSSGSRAGWRAELQRVALRELPFSENVRFTVEEIETALHRLQPPAPPVKNLAGRLRAATHGVPLALRALFDLHEQEQDSRILMELAGEGEEEPPEEGEAVRQVIETVAERMLYHLANRPDREADLADIIALAVLPRADSALLESLWPSGVRGRLRALAQRYSLLGGGELHLTVRHFLRRYWRQAGRPAVFSSVLARLSAIACELPLPPGEDIAAALERRLLLVTLASWEPRNAVTGDLARGLTVAFAHDEGYAPFVELLREIAETAPSRVPQRELLPKGDAWDGLGYLETGRSKIVSWLSERAAHSSGWDEEEKASMALLEGVAPGARESDEVAKSRLQMLRAAVEYFTSPKTPQKRAMMEALWNTAAYLQDRYRLRANPDAVPLIEHAYLTAIQLGPTVAILHNNLGNLYQDHLDRLHDAEREYFKAIELDPKYASPHNNLGNLYKNKLGRPQEAERFYFSAIELDPKLTHPHVGLGNLYKDIFDRQQEAEIEYLKAIELDPKYTFSHYNLGALYSEKLDRPQDAEREYLKAIELDPRFAHPHNGLGNLYKYKLDRPQDAEREYLKAIELDPKFAFPHNGLGNLYQDKLDRPRDAEREYLKAIELDPKFADPHNGLGNLYKSKLDRPQDAERAYLKAIELDPKFAFAHYNLGSLYHYQLDRPQDAERAYLRDAELDPKDPDPWRELGALYRDKLNRPEEAERAFLKAKAIEANK